MYSNCRNCKENLYEFMNFDTLSEAYIECPKCKHKMEVHYDDVFDGDEEIYEWWFEDYL